MAGLEVYENDPNVSVKFTHVSKYRFPEVYLGKKVLVYGHGSSAIQVATDISKSTFSLINVFKEPRWIKSRMIYHQKLKKHLPYDMVLWSTKETRMITEKITQQERNRWINKKLSEVSKQNSFGVPDLFAEERGFRRFSSCSRRWLF